LNDSRKFIKALGQIVCESLGQVVHTLVPIRSADVLAAPEFAAAAGLD
jgi:hypothetical protein